MLQGVRVRGRQFNSREPSDINKLASNREMFSSSVDAGFVLALPFHHRDLGPDCVEVSTGWALVRGIKIPPQVSTKNAGGVYA